MIILQENLSIKNKIWIISDINTRDLEFVKQKFNLSKISAEILINRSENSDDTYETILDPKIKNLLPNPLNFHDMKKSANAVINHILEKLPIGIISDYDVDGATSAALIYKFLNLVYHLIHKKEENKIICKIPHRVKDGYGPSKSIFDEFANEEITLVLTLDCGTTAFESIEYAKEIGIKVIVIDHHITKNKSLKAFGLINPHDPLTPNDIFSKTKDMAAVGITFIFCSAIIKILKNEHSGIINILSKELINMLDIVAIGTICDMMPIKGLNRAIIKNGINIIRKQKNIGIKFLCQANEINTLQAEDIGYILGPQINAGGRIGQNQYLGFKLLTTNSEIDALRISHELNVLNSMRKDINYDTQNEIEILIYNENLMNQNFILVHGSWHLGIIGIAASRLKEKFHKPSFVLSNHEEISNNSLNSIQINHESERNLNINTKSNSLQIDTINHNSETLKGSGRSVEGLHIGHLIDKAINMGILENGGGHAMACGFSIKRKNLQKFHEFLKEELTYYSWQADSLKIDSVISCSAINKNILTEIDVCAPYGNGNARPLFLIDRVFIKNILIIKEKHAKINLSDLRENINAMMFNIDKRTIEFIENTKSFGNLVSCVVSISEWRGNVSCKIEDITESTNCKIEDN
ncbi:single-stranded-DNA-specific exonuclease RecJ [Candidatus Gromoviella agglomerans]|uniref:single-stranded-DNA-specific exonuclease RecJ n=1 Tax=Candidatus Gromoviella agglomerans TaxID=2806609 RepID=UPI001E323C3B|nr:DHH family phosphoesterase [Candidatus Gromoviella agglomerans]UFX98593.1 Single-stranded-DNA-specific exonuclease RecJ [Candidatus Gromoviella agglomerans]